MAYKYIYIYTIWTYLLFSTGRLNRHQPLSTYKPRPIKQTFLLQNMMYNTLIFAIALAVPALGKPQPVTSIIPRDRLSQMTIKEANNACGSGQSVSCCNSIKQGDNTNESDGVLSGALSGLLAGGLSVLDQCSKIDVTAGMDSYYLSVQLHEYLLTIDSYRSCRYS